MTATYTPQPEWLNLEWHRATYRAGQLCLQRCGSCGRWQHPARRFCADCYSAEVSFEPVSGHGVVVSFAISHRSMDPGWASRVPFATLVVEVDEGPRVIAATKLDPVDVRIGLRVRLSAEPASENFALVWAAPA